ncbi:MAG: phosphomannomutase/phosphoglucomutase [Rhodospirillales bacterium]|jgi:phosphomannomutase|nr:phosphomannomutase/phosphoglucomutase [Rhodospirillales bacterium]HJO72042.1 phosphomannomutase/phosphoglucomutase [Rhodospirillales bacterium]
MKTSVGEAGRTLAPGILREYDIRGVVGDTLTEDGVAAIGRAFGTIVARQGGRAVAVGYDGRLSSPDLEAAAVAGLRAAGVDVARVGLGPTPMLYFATHALETDAGLMITGSHNPPEYNGIKMVLGGGSFFGADIQRLGALARAGDFAAGEGRASERPVADDYVRRLLEGFEEGRPLTVAWDPGNGAAGEVVQELCARLPGRHVLLNEGIDGTFPAHHPDPTVEANLEQLKRAVAEEACDVGFAFDGDGDRIGAVDSRGRVLWGDQLLAILAADVLAEVPGATVIADVKTSQMLFDEVERLGGRPVMWRTGHSLIKAKMAETGAEIAGEMSGHIFFKHRYYGFDDAIYAALRLLSIVGRSDVGGLTGLRDCLPAMINTPEVRFECADGRKFEVVDEVRERLGAMEGVQVSDIDGVRVRAADGWWLLRASNTQPVLVARCESSSREGLERLKEVLAGQLRLSGLEAPDFG